MPQEVFPFVFLAPRVLDLSCRHYYLSENIQYLVLYQAYKIAPLYIGYLKFVKKTFSFRKHFGTVLTEEIRIAKLCTEVFVMPKHLMTKVNIPQSYMSPLRAFDLSKQYYRITVIW